MKKLINLFLSLTFAMLMTGIGWAQDTTQSTTTTTTTDSDTGMKQDMKDAGSATKRAAKKGYHKTKRGTKKVIHKGAHKTRQGAGKVEQKTDSSTTPPQQ